MNFMMIFLQNSFLILEMYDKNKIEIKKKVYKSYI